MIQVNLKKGTTRDKVYSIPLKEKMSPDSNKQDGHNHLGGAMPKLIAFGITPRAVIAIGLLPMGVIAIGGVSMGIITIGLVGMGIVNACIVGMGLFVIGVRIMGLS